MLRRSGFKQCERERSPRPPIVPVVGQRGVIRQVSQEVVACPKEIILRSRPYRLYVAAQECFGCRLVGWSQCAHQNEGKGLGMKTCDSKTFPLCAPHHGLVGCHQQYDLTIDMGRQDARLMAALYVKKMQWRAELEGWRFTDTEIVKR